MRLLLLILFIFSASCSSISVKEYKDETCLKEDTVKYEKIKIKTH